MKLLLFLEHTISSEEIALDLAKIDGVQKIQLLKSTTKLRSFFNLTEYYRQFIQNFSTIAQLLNKLLYKDKPYY